MAVRIINADVMDGLRQLEDESVQCVVTSPPYYGLRDYGVEGQIGLEATPQAYVARMVEVFREVRRVLRKDGVCFLNLGDSYASTPSGVMRSSGLQGGKGTQENFRLATAAKNIPQGLKPKDLIGIPWRVAFALQDDGWYMRGDYIWHKPNPMPESVTDRCTKAHEYIFHLSKSERYFWDQKAIKEAASPDSAARYAAGYKQFGKAQFNGSPVDARGPKEIKAEKLAHLEGRNKRSVWTISTVPYAEAHFATFPPELPELCIKAGSKPGDTILDPFGGAGTTGLVADRLQRNAVLIELNPEYAAMAEARVNRDRGGLLDLMENQSS